MESQAVAYDHGTHPHCLFSWRWMDAVASVTFFDAKLFVDSLIIDYYVFSVFEQVISLQVFTKSTKRG